MMESKPVLSIMELGDQKPSSLVNYLLMTFGEFGLEILLQHVFLCALPAHIQDTPAATDCTALETLGDQADQVMSRPHRQAPCLHRVTL